MINKNNIELWQKLMEKAWYTQAGSGVSIYIVACAYSGFRMKEVLGYGYTEFTFMTAKGYVEMNYLKSDLENLWLKIKEKITDDPGYIEGVKVKYEKDFLQHQLLFEQIEKEDLHELSDEKLESLIDKIEKVQSDSVGLGHIIEAISLAGEKEFRKNLEDEIKFKELVNQYFVTLTSPSSLSFIAKEENDLAKIKLLREDLQKQELEAHFKKYFWIQNSYLGPQKLDIEFFEKRMNNFKQTQENIISKEDKEQVMQDLGLSEQLRKWARLFEFITVWQDERKANILKTISYVGNLVEEIGNRMNLDKKLVEHMTLQELRNFSQLDRNKMLQELTERYEGAYYYMNGEEELVISGDEYKKLISEKRAEEYKLGNEIRGMIANGGTVIGPVVVCKDISMFDKVKEGDILVTSMTRPEFMPILRKVAGIITDEGGITCHAAIVARELGIPAVIGTKIGTKILKDGMMVELRANHGLVKIIGE